MITEEFCYLLANTLFVDSPVLSGNMKTHIKIVQVGEKEAVIEISAKFYDQKIWKKSKAKIFTGSPKKWGWITDYPMWVNEIGAFGKYNESEHWVNRTCYNVSTAIANKYGGIVNNELEL